VRLADEFGNLGSADACAQDAGGSLLHFQGHVFGALHQRQFCRGLVIPARVCHARSVYELEARFEAADTVEHEERQRRAQAHHSIGSDAHSREHVEQQAVGTLVLMPAMDSPVYLAEIADGALFECRGDIGQRSIGGQHRADHAFARTPLHPGEVAQVAASIQVEGGDALLAHQALGLGNA